MFSRLHLLNPLTTVLRCQGVAAKPTCVSIAALQHLNQHARPRAIHVVTAGGPEACRVFTSVAPNVACHDDDTFLPGVNHTTIAALLQQSLGANAASETAGRKLGGWYLQQACTGRHSPGLG
jgi:hypothetical protein